MSRQRVFVSRRIADAGLSIVTNECDATVWESRTPPPYETFIKQVQGIEGLLCMLTDRIDAPLMDAAGPGLKVISQMAVGYDNIDVRAAQERGIAVGHTPGVLTEATADLTFGLLLAAARKIVEGVAYIRAGYWQTWDPGALVGGDLNDATLGLIGLGRIGKAVARRAAGFNMRILAYSPHCPAEEAAAIGVRLVSLEELLQSADYVSIHTPLNMHTRGLINGERLSQMKPTAILVNTARGPIVNQNALYEAIRDGVIGGAALDVTDPEPISPSDPLLSMPNVIVVPHIGSASRWTRDQMALLAAQNLIAGLRGQPLLHHVPI